MEFTKIYNISAMEEFKDLREGYYWDEASQLVISKKKADNPKYVNWSSTGKDATKKRFVLMDKNGKAKSVSLSKIEKAIAENK